MNLSPAQRATLKFLNKIAPKTEWYHPFIGTYPFRVGTRICWYGTVMALRQKGLIDFEGEWRELDFRLRLTELGLTTLIKHGIL